MKNTVSNSRRSMIRRMDGTPIYDSDRLVGGGRPLMAARRPRDDVRIKRRIEHEGEEEKRLDESKTRLVAVRGKSPSRRKCD